MSKTRRKFTSEEKVSLLRQHFLDGRAVSEICEEYQLSVSQFYRWQEIFFANGSAAFNVRKAPKKDPRDKKIAELEAKIADRDEGIAELMTEYVKLKKNFAGTE